MERINFNNYDGQKAIEKAIREDVQKNLINCCIETFGAENVSITKHGITIARGDKTLADGTKGEVCCTISFKAENYDDRITNSGKVLRAFNRIAEANSYEDSILESMVKAEEKERQKKERYERARKAKAEKLRKKLEALESSMANC